MKTLTLRSKFLFCVLTLLFSCIFPVQEIQDLTGESIEIGTIKYWMIGNWKPEYSIDPYQYILNPYYDPKITLGQFRYIDSYYSDGTGQREYYPNTDSARQYKFKWSIEEEKRKNLIDFYGSRWRVKLTGSLGTGNSCIQKLTKDTLVIGDLIPHGIAQMYYSRKK